MPSPDPRTTVPAAPADTTAPHVPSDTAGPFGRYEVLHELGRGGMGIVYKARDPDLRRDVALKVLTPELAVDPRAVERGLREARAQARIAHEHVVSIYDVGQDAGGPYIVMQYLEGRPLGAVTPLPVSDLVRVGREIAEGLAAAHVAGLIHRDIKPGNIWLEAPKGRVKILDFGLARDGESRDPSHTAADSFAGTPAYMSPEQARGQKVDFRTDLFSFGAVLYQLATGSKPFPQTVLLDLLNAVVRDEPPPLLGRVPECPRELAALVAKLMAKDPAVRPASAERVAEELRAIERALGAPPVLVLPHAPADPFAQLADGDTDADRTERLAPPAPRATEAPAARRWLWSAAGALVLGLLVWLAVRYATPEKRAAQSPEPRPAAPKKSSGPPVLKPVHTFVGPPDSTRVVALAYSANGNQLAAQFEFPDSRFTIVVWETTARAETTSFLIDSRLEGLGFLPDASRLATADHTHGAIRVWNLHTRQQVAEYGRGLTDRFFSAQVAPNGELVSGGNRGRAYVFDLVTGGKPNEIAFGTSAKEVRAVRSPNRQRFAYSLGNERIQFARAEPFQECGELVEGALHLGHPFTEDGSYLVAVRGDKLLWVNAETAKSEKEFAGMGDEIRGGFVAVTPDGKFVAACSTDMYNRADYWPPGRDPRLRVWDTATGQQVACTEEYPGTAQVLAVSRDSKFVALGGYSKPAEVRVYRLPDASAAKKP